jgi:hypothetical protein
MAKAIFAVIISCFTIEVKKKASLRDAFLNIAYNSEFVGVLSSLRWSVPIMVQAVAII